MDSVVELIHRCVQRDEHPLTAVDLIERDLLNLNQAAWLVSRVAAGSSWLVGGMPSHAGKTTLMSALLVFLPAQEQVSLAHPGQAWDSYGPACCVVGEEVSDHRRSLYLWGEDVRGLASVPSRGGRIASTIHATSLAQVREQIADQCAAGEAGVAAFGTFVPIEVTYDDEVSEDAGSAQERRRRPIRTRTVTTIHYHDGHDHGEWRTIGRDIELTSDQEEVAAFLRTCAESGIRSCEALRKAWLDRG